MFFIIIIISNRYLVYQFMFDSPTSWFYYLYTKSQYINRTELYFSLFILFYETWLAIWEQIIKTRYAYINSYRNISRALIVPLICLAAQNFTLTPVPLCSNIMIVSPSGELSLKSSPIKQLLLHVAPWCQTLIAIKCQIHLSLPKLHLACCG